MIHIADGIIDLNMVESCLENVKLEDGTLQGDVLDNKRRRSKVAWLKDKQLRYEICDYVMGINAGTLGLDLFPFQAEVQYAEYHAEDAGHFDWHQDHDPFAQTQDVSVRKYSATLQLSTMGDNYDGGKFEIQNMEIPDKHYNRGSFILFPSPMLHRVTPVTRGTRRALVFFFHGPRWR